MLTVRCPRCSHDMRCNPKIDGLNPTVTGKSKRCVYCGHTFRIHEDLERTNIVAPNGTVPLNSHFS